MAMEAIPFDLHATGVVDLQAASATTVGGGRYSLRRILGRGGMGIVWLAKDNRLNREVALKFLPPQIRYDAAALDELRRETSRSQGLSHPNIVRIHDLYEAEGEDPFISMEYVDGSNLANIRVQQPERVLSWTYLEPLMRQLCEALHYAHGEGIIHRDLKPANLMVDQTGRLKLADFGIARALTDTMTRSSLLQTSGTLIYMSPQQLDGGLPRPSDDVYGMGAVLYELLTSKPPFYTGDLLHQVRNSVPKPMAERLREFGLSNDIPPYLNDLVLACLNKDDKQRPPTVREVGRWIVERRSPLKCSGPTGWRRATRDVLYLASRYGAACKKLFLPVASRRGVAPRLTFTVGAPRAVSRRIGRFPAVALAAIVLAAAVWLSSRSPHLPSTKTETAAARTIGGNPPAIAAPATALEVIRTGNAHVSQESKNKIIHMASVRTPISERPRRWRVIYYDPQALYNAVELRFESGQVARMREPARILGLFGASPPPLDLVSMRIDSDQATRIAMNLPSVKQRLVKAAELELERGPGGASVWKVRLFAPNYAGEEKDIGYVLVRADDGVVLKESLL